MTDADDRRSGGEQQESIVVDDPDNPIRNECPDCGLSGEVPESWRGLKAECKDCDEQYEIPGAANE